MGRLNTMQGKVEAMLKKYPVTRDNDRLLIGTIYSTYYDVDMNTPFKEILKDDKLPEFETIRRCRQKAQADHEELRGKRDKERIEIQKEFIEYAKQDTTPTKIKTNSCLCRWCRYYQPDERYRGTVGKCAKHNRATSRDDSCEDGVKGKQRWFISKEEVKE